MKKRKTDKRQILVRTLCIVLAVLLAASSIVSILIYVI